MFKPNSPTRHIALISCCALLFATVASAGALRLGQPNVQGDRYVFPVNLSGGQDSVAALNFTLSYDPTVFRAVDASAGTLAQMTNKVVTAHAPAEGAFNVVMVGFNQQTLDNGEVARVVLERIGGSDGSSLSITEPTLAAWDGGELPSTGGGLKLSFDGDKVTSEETAPEPGSESSTRDRDSDTDSPAEEAAGEARVSDGTAGSGLRNLNGIPTLSPLPGPMAPTTGSSTAEAAADGSSAPAVGTAIPMPSGREDGAPVGRIIPGSVAPKKTVEDGLLRLEIASAAGAQADAPDNAAPRAERSGDIKVVAQAPMRTRFLLVGGAAALVFAGLALWATRKILFR